MEFRIYAEDPKRFLPSPGKVTRLSFPKEKVKCAMDTGDSGRKREFRPFMIP